MDDQEQQQGREPRINSTSAVLMVATALLFDVISIIPVVGQAIAVVGSAVVFFIWFKILDLPLISPKKLLTTLLSYLGESVPAVSALPLITAGVILMIVITRTEDKTGINVMNAASAVKNPTKALKPNITPKMNDMLPSSTQS